MRYKWRQQQYHRFNGLFQHRHVAGLVFGLKCLNGVDHLHYGSDGRVEMESVLDIIGNLADGLMHQTAQGFTLVCKGCSIERTCGAYQWQAFVDKFPYPVQEPITAVDSLIAPVEIFFGGGGK